LFTFSSRVKEADAVGAVKLHIPKDVADLPGNNPEEVERSVHEIFVLSLYRQHEVSAGRAAELLGMELMAFARWSSSLGIPYFDTDPEDWENQLRALEKLERLDSES
jgi:predicted HTH domain antitoxin